MFFKQYLYAGLVLLIIKALGFQISKTYLDYGDTHMHHMYASACKHSQILLCNHCVYMMHVNICMLESCLNHQTHACLFSNGDEYAITTIILLLLCNEIPIAIFCLGRRLCIISVIIKVLSRQNWIGYGSYTTWNIDSVFL